jgi:structural maintenance of chromosome 1
MLDAMGKTMSERGDHLKVIKDQMNRVEDDIFHDFCKEIGVDNIR